MVELAGFAYTNDRKFGVSVDGLIDADGVWECKTMVSSKTLFKAVVDGDISEYRDQCLGAMWLLHRKWVDLTLWAPDINGRSMTVIRIQRDEDAIEALKADLMAFESVVDGFEKKLRSAMLGDALVG
jgi:exodeoxyribonuclease (lambda-induced)